MDFMGASLFYDLALAAKLRENGRDGQVKITIQKVRVGQRVRFAAL
jgi:hypothetical protein